MTPTRLLTVLFLCFFLSGATGLIYEIVWIRMLGLVFGHTVHAITTVLVAFMGGLALGSFLCGRVVDRTRGLLKIYAILEILIGVYCLLTPWLMDVVKATYLGLARSVELPFVVLTLTQFALSSLVILVPTTLMGATLPVLARFTVRELSTVGRGAGSLYAVNTFGAVLGTYLVGFELLPAFGMNATLVITAFVNLAIGAVILLVQHRGAKLGLAEPEISVQTPMTSEPSQAVAGSWWNREQVLVLGFALSGAVSMVYEIAWTRALTLVIGSSTYAFTVMLLSFLGGIAGGSALFARVTSRFNVTPVWFATLQIVIAASVAIVSPVIDRLPDLFLWGFRVSDSPGHLLALQVALSIAVMIVPTLCIGATFPCIAQVLATERSRIGSHIGRVYAYNTAGAIIGSFAAGFVLIPTIGTQATLQLGIVINFLVGVTIVLWYVRSPVRLAWSAAVAVGAVAVLLLPPWDHKVMNGGVAVYAPRFAQDSSWREFLNQRNLLYFRDGISATVTVYESNALTVLVVNGKSDASSSLDPHTESDLPTQLMSGHLPALIHPDPKTALVIGLGSGVTVGALAQYPLQTIDVAEIEPAVVEASAFFAEANRQVLSDPRVRQAVTDGRNFLLTTEDRYDIIVSEPSNPWIRGMATLFTVEFFALARQHLQDDGVMVQWLQAYSMAPEDFRMVVASFQTAFPHATLWATLKGDFLLIGTPGPLEVDLERVRARYLSSPTLRQDFQRTKLASPEAIFSNFYLNEDELRRFAAGAPLNTDDRLPLEFSAPRSLYRDTLSQNFEALRLVKTSLFPPLRREMLETLDRPSVHFDVAIGLIAKRLNEEAVVHLNRALVQNPEYSSALILRGWLYGSMKRFPDALRDLQTAVRINRKDAAAHHQLGLLYLAQNMIGEGIESLREAVALAPEDERYRLDLVKAIRQHT